MGSPGLVSRALSGVLILTNRVLIKLCFPYLLVVGDKESNVLQRPRTSKKAERQEKEKFPRETSQSIDLHLIPKVSPTEYRSGL